MIRIDDPSDALELYKLCQRFDSSQEHRALELLEKQSTVDPWSLLVEACYMADGIQVAKLAIANFGQKTIFDKILGSADGASFSPDQRHALHETLASLWNPKWRLALLWAIWAPSWSDSSSVSLFPSVQVHWPTVAARFEVTTVNEGTRR